MFTTTGTAVKEKQSNSRIDATGVRTGALSKGSPVTATAGETRLLPHTSYTGMLELSRAFLTPGHLTAPTKYRLGCLTAVSELWPNRMPTGLKISNRKNLLALLAVFCKPRQSLGECWHWHRPPPIPSLQQWALCCFF